MKKHLAATLALVLAAGSAMAAGRMGNDQQRDQQVGQTEDQRQGMQGQQQLGGPGSQPGTVGGQQAQQGQQGQQDQQLTQRVRQNLMQDQELSQAAQQLDIQAQDGTVTLSGRVQSEDQKDQILERVEEVTGVEDVQDRLIVGTGGQQQQQR